MSKYPEDEQRLLVLSKGEDADWQRFYNEVRSPFRLFLMKYSQCTPELALELFHEAMVIFHRKVTQQQLEAPLQSSLRTYLFGIGKMLMRKQFSTDSKVTDAEIPDIPIAPVVDAIAEDRQNAMLVQQLLNQIGEPCKQLLELFYLKGYAIDAITATMEFPSEGAVRKRKFDCLKKMRELMG
jgi:RNA polymerase sigma factor (sigma-70 family)